MGLFDSSSSSTSNLTSNLDQRQVNTTTDSNNVDSSIHTSIMNLLDGGAINMGGAVAVAALGKVGDIASNAIQGASGQTKMGYDYADGLFSSVTKYANGVNNHMADAYSQAANLQNDALVTAQAAYRQAGSSVADAYQGAQDAIRLAMRDSSASAQAAQGATQAAYADAKGTTDSQKQIILGVLAVAALFALVAFKSKG